METCQLLLRVLLLLLLMMMMLMMMRQLCETANSSQQEYTLGKSSS